LLHDYLAGRSRRNDAVGLFLHSLRHGKDCSVEIANARMQVRIDTENYTIDIGE